MGHDTHFLERLSRVSTGQVERALMLYRDPELVRKLLACVPLEGDAPRVAVALEPEPEGPHVVLARNGHFVTCLGAGMKPRGLQVVSKAALDGIVTRLNRERGATEAWEEITERSGRLLTLLGRKLIRRASEMTREEMMSLVAVSPLWGQDFHNVTLATHRAFIVWVRHEQDHHGSIPQRRQCLSHIWNLAWGLGNEVLLGAAGGLHDDDPNGVIAKNLLSLLEHAGLYGVLLPQVVRLLWSINRLGPSVLPLLKERYLATDTTHFHCLVGAALVLMALTHPATRDEVEATLSMPPSHPSPTGETEANRAALLHDLRTAWRHALEHPRESVEQAISEFRGTAAERAAQVGVPPPSDEMLPTLALYSPDALSGDQWPSYYQLIRLLPWLARANAEDLYIPVKLLPSFGQPFNDEVGQAWSEAALRAVRTHPRRPIEGQGHPGRNDPCPCGSRQKYKRCCGTPSHPAQHSNLGPSGTRDGTASAA